MAMRPVSARSTAPYQTLLFFSSRTLPASVAFFGHKRRAVVGRGMVVYCDESHTIASPFFFAHFRTL